MRVTQRMSNDEDIPIDPEELRSRAQAAGEDMGQEANAPPPTLLGYAVEYETTTDNDGSRNWDTARETLRDYDDLMRDYDEVAGVTVYEILADQDGVTSRRQVHPGHLRERAENETNKGEKR